MVSRWQCRASPGLAGLLLCVAVLLCSCGGGGGRGPGDGPVAGNPPPPQPPPPPPPAGNHSPVLAKPNSIQRAVHLHAFEYDPTQGGTTFTDPDGDVLRYEVRISASFNDPTPPPGMRVEDNRIVGTPAEQRGFLVTITAFDSLDWTAYDEFSVQVAPNSSPVVANANSDLIATVGELVDTDASKGGAALSDPDGDALTYELSLRGEPRGLSVNGTRISGVMASIGLVEVTVTARDAFGGSGNDVFLIAAPAAEPGAPTLPNPSYVYRDEDLPLPFLFQLDSDFSQPADNRITDAGATLGRVLFYDKRLSITNTVACASCHQQSRGFSSPDQFSTGALGVPTKRHAMALGNVRFGTSHRWFADMRVNTLEDLVLEPLQNPEELGSSLTLMESKLSATSFYPPLFEAAFGTPEITTDRVRRAVAQFLRSLLSYRAKVDLAFNPMTNDPWQPELVLSPQEMRGFEIFDDGGRRRCNLCHDVHFGHNVWQANNGLDVIPTDLGTLNPALQRDGSLGVFRAGNLRNVEVSGPYMHDGRFATLRDVINHYDHGVQDGPHLDSMLRDVLGTGLPHRLNLAEEDKDALEAFLRTMTDVAFLTDPKFSDPFD